MPSRKRKTTAKATANAIANATAKAIAKVIATAAKAKATRARNKATAARIDRILQSSPPPTASPTGPSGPSETIGSNLAAELIIARADFKEVLLNRKPQTAWVIIYIRYGIKFDPNKTPPPEEKIITMISKTEKRTHLINIAGKDLSTDSNSSDSQSDSYTRLSKSELTRNLKKKTQRKLARLKAKKERARLRARTTITSRQYSELEFAVASLTGRHLWEYKIQ
ncbi:hypothetical protein NA56DRAFT_656502 [Hyaloscypha hepaticicola]|uniref:Uncharacterized protein n=1 Tax=Hyaloscypha hepaticicola TaxID=2082293 RepID=A0A2J6QCQ2_9HELO|nr:hypothetical protein NA56DRAFT_656502 [Hyaloscypha hepaticicola]